MRRESLRSKPGKLKCSSVLHEVRAMRFTKQTPPGPDLLAAIFKLHGSASNPSFSGNDFTSACTMRSFNMNARGQRATIMPIGEKRGERLIVRGEEFTAHHESDHTQ